MVDDCCCDGAGFLCDTAVLEEQCDEEEEKDMDVLGGGVGGAGSR